MQGGGHGALGTAFLDDRVFVVFGDDVRVTARVAVGDDKAGRMGAYGLILLGGQAHRLRAQWVLAFAQKWRAAVRQRQLLDREIMLTCLVEAADEVNAGDFRSGRRGRRLLDARVRAARARRQAAMQRADARALRARRAALALLAQPESIPPRRATLISSLATNRLVLELRRVDLMVHLADAADLRSSASALRAEAQQVRLRAQRRQR